jgi:hypothetical protein
MLIRATSIHLDHMTGHVTQIASHVQFVQPTQPIPPPSPPSTTTHDPATTTITTNNHNERAMMGWAG